jgi:hypothetical protein
MRIRLWQKIVVTIAAFAVAIICFMVRLPSSFSHVDKELHTLFIFLQQPFSIFYLQKESVDTCFYFWFAIHIWCVH